MELFVLRLLNTIRDFQNLNSLPFYEADLSSTEALTLMRACCPSEVPEEPPTSQVPLQASELVRDLGVSAAAISQVVANLESRGLIRREPSAKDKRVTQILPTAQGCALANQVRENCLRLDNLLTQSMTEEEQRYLSRILDKINAIVTEESNRMGLPRRRTRHKCTNDVSAHSEDECAATAAVCNANARGDTDHA